MNTLMRLALLGIALLLGGCFGSKDNMELPTPLVEFTPTLTVEEVWSASAGGRSDLTKLTPTRQGDTLFTATAAGLIRAFTLSDGQRLWEHQVKDRILTGGVGVGDDLVLVGSRNGQVIALAASDGSERWQAQVSSEVLSAPRAQGGVVVARSLDGKLYGLDSQSGRGLWVYERTVPLLTLRGTSSPVIAADAVIAGFDSGKLAALQLTSGKLLWEIAVALPRGRSELERMVDIDADPVIKGDTIYTTSFRGRVVAVDQKGSLVWEREISSYAGLNVDATAVYVSDEKSHLWAFDRTSGASLWKQEKLQAREITAPAILDKTIVVGDKEGYLHWLRQEDGQFVARHRTGKNPITVPPLVVGDLLIVYTSAGEITALRSTVSAKR